MIPAAAATTANTLFGDILTIARIAVALSKHFSKHHTFLCSCTSADTDTQTLDGPTRRLDRLSTNLNVDG